MRKNKLTGLSDKMSDIVLVAMCTAIMLIVAYPLYYVLIASMMFTPARPSCCPANSPCGATNPSLPMTVSSTAT